MYHRMIGGSVSLYASTEYPAKLSLEGSWSSWWAPLPAMKQHINKNVDTKKYVDLARLSEPRIHQRDIRDVLPIEIEGHRRGRSRVTRGTITAEASIFLLSGFMAEIFN